MHGETPMPLPRGGGGVQMNDKLFPHSIVIEVDVQYQTPVVPESAECLHCRPRTNVTECYTKNSYTISVDIILPMCSDYYSSWPQRCLFSVALALFFGRDADSSEPPRRKNNDEFAVWHWILIDRINANGRLFAFGLLFTQV